jgi:hypothetical protein
MTNRAGNTKEFDKRWRKGRAKAKASRAAKRKSRK